MTQRFYANSITKKFEGSYDGDHASASNPYIGQPYSTTTPPHKDAILDENGLWQYDNTADKWEDVRSKQRSMIVKHQDMMEIHEREVAHTGTSEIDYTITPAKYQEFLTYFQTIRQNDEALHPTPQDALDALDNLSEPSLS